MQKTFCLIFCVLLIFLFESNGQIIDRKLKITIEKSREEGKPMQIATHFLGLPYVAFALSKENPEQLITDLSGFDCVTFFDNVYALYKSKGIDSVYINELIKVRYYHPGRVTFENRNHYFSSTIEKLSRENELIAIKEPSVELRTSKKLNVLSEYLKKRSLKVSIDSVKKMENKFSNAEMNYIPRNAISKILPKIHDGDLVLFLTHHQTMDFHHVGFLVKKGKDWHVLHASQQYKKVIVSPETLMQYMQKHPSFPGIQVYHLNLP